MSDKKTTVEKKSSSWDRMSDLIVQQKTSDEKILSIVQKEFPDKKTQMYFIQSQRSKLNHGKIHHPSFNPSNMEKLVKVDDTNASKKPNTSVKIEKPVVVKTPAKTMAKVAKTSAKTPKTAA